MKNRRFDESKFVHIDLEHHEVIKLIKLIIEYNSEAFPQLHMMFEPLLDRQAAALKIQQSFRSYIRRRSLRLLMAGEQNSEDNFLNDPYMLFHNSILEMRNGSFGYADL